MENDMKFKWWEPYVYSFIVSFFSVTLLWVLFCGAFSFIFLEVEPLKDMFSPVALRVGVGFSFVLSILLGTGFHLDNLGKK
jgi:hypothetical protein